MSAALLISYLRHGWVTAAAWAGSLLLYGLFLASLYQTQIQTFSNVIKDYMRALPEPFRVAFGAGGSEGMEAFFGSGGGLSIEGWIAVEFMSWLPVLLAVWAVVSMGGAISREVERKTIDLVLAQPMPRHRLVLTKFAYFAMALAAVVLLSYVGVLIGVRNIGESINEMALLLSFVGWFLLVMAFAGISILFSCLFLDPRRSVMVSGLLLAGLYMLNIFATIFEEPWRSLNKLSPFHYYEPLTILQKASIDTAALAVFLGVTVVSLLLAVVVFQRRDLTA